MPERLCNRSQQGGRRGAKDQGSDRRHYVTYYNRASGINAGTREAGNLVLVHSGNSIEGGSTGQSWLLQA